MNRKPRERIVQQGMHDKYGSYLLDMNDRALLVLSPNLNSPILCTDVHLSLFFFNNLFSEKRAAVRISTEVLQ